MTAPIPAILPFPSGVEPPSPRDVPDDLPLASVPLDADVAFRQLRHHTKNALQRILCQVALQPGLMETQAGRILASDVERRIHLVAAISDALFGFTRAPEPLSSRLRMLGESVIELLCDPGQIITFSVSVEGLCPAPLEATLVRVAHELIGNAVKHGMHVRLVGQIAVRVRSEAGVTWLTVSDDGWGYPTGPDGEPIAGEGLSLVRLLVEPYGGEVRLRRQKEQTHVSATLPHRLSRAIRG